MLEICKKMFCKHCGENAGVLLFHAMMETAGAKVYPSSTHCAENQQHEFEIREPKILAG